MPQGLLEKIQVHLLPADLALELRDLAPGLGKIARPSRGTARQSHRSSLGAIRPPRTVPNRLLPARANRIAPAVQNRPLDPKLARQSGPALARLHPANNLKLEITTKTSPQTLRHGVLS
jgi:hypothetical protein